MVRASIIVVSYNCLHDTTAPCLDSIFAGPAERDFEVVVVDNNSSDETVSWLKEKMAGEPRLRCVFNGQNRGFAGGNNDGIRAAGGEYLVLLNSDCVVSGDWIEGLTAPLARERSIGMTGPVTNSTGNEQKIFTSGGSPEEIMREGLAWASMSRGWTFDTGRLAFFCVAMRADVAKQVGFLDENFGPGFYEDDDYCIRVQKAGYRLVCVEDVFVYHRGGGSFESSGFATHALMKQNRKKLEQKQGLPYKPVHPRNRQLQVIAGYLDRAPDGKIGPDLGRRIANRMRVIESLMPRGPVKRFFFRRRLREVAVRLRAMGYEG